MRNPKNLGEAVRGALKEKDLTQEYLAGRVHVDRTSISKYINGHTPMPNDIKSEIVICLDDPLVRNFAYGTPTFSVYIDNDNFDAFRSNHRGIKEMKEAISAIEKALNFIDSIDNIDQLEADQKKEFEQTLKEVMDAEILCRTITIRAKKDLNVNTDPIAKRCIRELVDLGLVSKPLARSQGAL